jgi:hypothetical protein
MVQDQPVGPTAHFITRLQSLPTDFGLIPFAALPARVLKGLVSMKHLTWMNNTLIGAWGLFVFFSIASGQEPVEPVNLPRVLIIGDSISLGYTPEVKAILKGEAVVVHNAGNAEHTGTGIEKIDQWLGTEKWDVIHFNWGLWDLCYRHPESKVPGKRDKVRGKLTQTPENYAANLELLVQRLLKTEAKLIWCATTPVPEGEPGRFEGAALEYNAVAEKVMRRHGVRINDLHHHALSKLGDIQKPNDVHFTAAGSRYLAEKVAAEIREDLKSGSAK